MNDFAELEWHFGRNVPRAVLCFGSGFRFHDLRHTRGTRILRVTRNLAAAKKALAHRNIKTTLRYAHVLDDDVREALEVSDSRTIPKPNNSKHRKL
jgi:integrase